MTPSGRASGVPEGGGGSGMHEKALFLLPILAHLNLAVGAIAS
jgi:hypothetical protein